MVKNEDLPPELREQDTPQPLVEELPLEEAPAVPPLPAEPKAQTPPPADPYLRRNG